MVQTEDRSGNSYSLHAPLPGASLVSQAGDVVYWKIPLDTCVDADQKLLTTKALNKISETLTTQGKTITLPDGFSKQIQNLGPQRLALLKRVAPVETTNKGIVVGVHQTTPGGADPNIHFVLAVPWLRVAFDSFSKEEIRREQRIDLMECKVPLALFPHLAANGLLIGTATTSRFPCRPTDEASAFSTKLEALKNEGTAVVLFGGDSNSGPIATITTLSGNLVAEKREEH
jgi:hypothetical protein